jgi:hypothetical protein
MNNDDEIINDITGNPCFKKLDKRGLINRTKLRNIKIKREFIMLRTRMTPLDAIEYLSKKYLRSVSTIHAAVYRSKRKLRRIKK